MKIGILTLPLHTNYGGILQAYALQTVLEREGHQVVVFDTDNHLRLPLWRMPITLTLRFLQKLQGKEKYILKEQRHNREYPIISQHIQPFVDKHVHRYIVKRLSDLDSENYDAIVVGSDQVWRPNFFRLRYRCLADAYLKFARHWSIKRIAYAASFGTDSWEYSTKETSECGKYARLFDLVTVRETSAVKLCRKHFNVEAQYVLDPTMLLEANDYLGLIDSKKHPGLLGEENENPCKSPTLIHYILDDSTEKSEFIERLAHQKGLLLLKINSRVEDESAPLSERIQPSVQQWLRGFNETEFVVTDSFHACVFSILFKKQFLVCINEGRGATRFHSLLSLFGLEDRIVTNFTLLSQLPPIDYASVDIRLFEWRKKSLALLLGALR